MAAIHRQRTAVLALALCSIALPPAVASTGPHVLVVHEGAMLSDWTSALDEVGAVVTEGSNFPADPSPYDIIYLESYAAAQSTPPARLTDYVANGGAMILDGGVPYLACGSTGSIACLGWFGYSVTYANLGAGASSSVVANAPFGSALTVGDPIVVATAGPGAAGLSGIGSPSTELARWNGGPSEVVQSDPPGGRAVYFATWSSDNSELNTENSHALMVASLRWLTAEGQPPVPTPELPTIGLLGAGLVGLASLSWGVRRRLE